MDKNLYEIDAFYSMNEFLKFQDWIYRQIENGSAKEVDVRVHYSDAGFEERWFEFKSVGQVWRLVYPDPPFKGYWGRAE